MLISLVFACTPPEEKPKKPAEDSAVDSAVDSGNPPVLCEDGTSARSFEEVAESSELRATAADFTIETTAGSWNFKENWNGCDSYLFIPESPRQNTQTGVEFWGSQRDNGALLSLLPPNTHVFFIATGRSTEAIDTLQDSMTNDVFPRLSGEEQALWSERLHYVTTVPADIGGWLGSALRSPGWGLGIDRFQKIRYIGAFTDPQRYNSETQWFNDNLRMAGNEAVYYNFEALREARLEAQDAMVLPAFSGEVISDSGWAGARGYATIEFPDAATLADYDTLEFDLSMMCEGEGEYGTCPAWDYLVYMHLCDDSNTTDCPTEIGRWITTYHREGRWVHDVSPLLPLFAEGGTKHVSFYTTQPYEVTLSARLSKQGVDRPKSAQILHYGGYLSPQWEADHPPVSVDIPADVTRVELALVMSGHGMQSPGNCAEFCEIENHFLVNGTDNLVQFTEPGDNYSCMDQAAVGTVPNQYGTWWYGRNGWCPGKEVPVTRVDITDQVTIGAANSFQYLATFGGEPYPGGDARQETTAWLVYY